MEAVVITSGGLDSTVLCHMVAKQFGGPEIQLLSFDYGQKHSKELDFAYKTAERLNCNWDLVDLTSITKLIASSALTSDEDVPEGHYAEDNMRRTIVPNRNMTMLSIGISVAVSQGANYVYAGMHAGDHFVYPDCRPPFFEALQLASNHANEGFDPPTLVFPFSDKSKADIVTIGKQLKVPFTQTWSCYKGGKTHCGKCGTCVERAEAFFLACIEDPTVYMDKYYWRKAAGLVK